jgi:WD40 repeat protein/tRNA A-37 threonylcarbamoyl transferase component Bud32
MLEEGVKASGKNAADQKADQTRTLTENRRAGSGEPISGEDGQGGSSSARESGGGAKTPGRPDESSGRSLRGAPDDLGGSLLPPGDPGRYELVDEHARGGLGRILKARDNQLGRTVAVKELLSRSPSSEARFVREAMITARLQHPGIVPVHEAGRWPSGDPYYVMKLISGSTLKERIAGSESFGDRLALLPHAIAVFEAIGYAHSKDIIHRDLKPSNVVVGEFGETVVVDWGLAKHLAEPSCAAPASGDESGASGSGSSSADATADVVGTPAYMSPEQAEGGDVDKHADVYSLGALLYHLLTGAPPYSRRSGDLSSSDKLVQVIEGPPRPIAEVEPAVPSDLAAIVEKAMSRGRGDRYADAFELAEDLKRYSTGKLVTAQEYTNVELVRRWLHRNRAPVAAAVVGLIATAVVGALAVNRIINERNTAQRERAQAQAAQRSSEEQATELIYQQAAASLDGDPTAAIAWLKRYPMDGPRAARVAEMVEEARASGVAEHVFPHDDWVHAIDFTAGGKSLLSASQDGSVSLWDLETGERELLLSQSGHKGIRAAATSRSRSMAAYGGVDGVVHVIDLESRETFELVGHRGPVRTVRFIGDSELLMTLADDQRVRIWDLEARETRRIFQATSKPSRGGANLTGTHVVDIDDSGLVRVHDVVADTWREVKMPPFPISQKLAVSAGANRLASAGGDGKIRLVDLERRTVAILGDHPGQIGYAEFSPSGKWLVTASSDTTIRLWDLSGSDHIVLRGHTDSVYEVDFSPDETRMISAGDDRTARIWDLRTQNAQVLRGHADDVWKALWSPDGEHVATASLDGDVRIWPTRFDDSRILVGHGDRFVSHVDYSASGLISQGRDGEFLRWDLERGEPTEIGDAWAGYGYPSWESKEPVVMSADRSRGVSRRADGRIDLWELSGGGHRILERPAGFVANRLRLPAISADGQRVAASDGKRVVEWSLAAGTASVIERSEIATLAYDPNGSLLMAVWDGGIIERATDGTIRGLKTDGFVGAGRLLFSAHGEVLVALGEGGRILVIDRATGDTMTVATDGHTLVSAAISADGRRVAGAGADRAVYVWDVDTGREQVFEGHDDLVHGVAFSPDGRLLASSSHDKTVRLWDLASGRSRVLRGHTNSVHDVSFSPDGKSLASAARDGTVRVWQVPPMTLDVASVVPRLRALTSAVITDNDAEPVTPIAARAAP